MTTNDARAAESGVVAGLSDHLAPPGVCPSEIDLVPTVQANQLSPGPVQPKMSASTGKPFVTFTPQHPVQYRSLSCGPIARGHTTFPIRKLR